ncbi:uncharacterized protein LOC131176465 [Hevea brasiliensis]|uniref:uncharacterized protein LOC131176465 n=1 Tax=Hevea brasiliensis TaxID=3981 RepID=UPI0025D8298D|nr:uncharacterized protein LOC131176465 [Hevea brasiliensis]
MGPKAFVDLCDILVRNGGLRPTLRVFIEEQVAKTLYLLGHNVSNRVLGFFFCRSGETDCAGIIDGTHIRVKVSRKEAPKYSGRKDYPTQNVLAACTFDLKFTYVLPGWEGIAPDSRIMKNALTREYPLKILQDMDILAEVDDELNNGSSPQEHCRHTNRDDNEDAIRGELLRDSIATNMNAIERTFGVLKKRFSIITSSTEPHYGVDTQEEIILVCCILHNYLIGVNPDMDVLAEVDDELNNGSSPQEHCRHTNRDDNEDAIRG